MLHVESTVTSSHKYSMSCSFVTIWCFLLAVGSVHNIEDTLFLGRFPNGCGTQDPFPPGVSISQIEICLNLMKSFLHKSEFRREEISDS